jgi:protein phosphatase
MRLGPVWIFGLDSALETVNQPFYYEEVFSECDMGLKPCKLSDGRFLLAVDHYTAAALTDVGRKRASNEDAFGFSVEHGAYVVCDGMGGAAAGEIASSLAVGEVLRLLEGRNENAGVGEAETMPAVAEQAVHAANEVVFSRAQSDDKLSGMGTTLVVLVAEKDRLWVLNVGDSRCYRLRNQCLEQLTLDHSLVEEMVRLGRMTPDEALNSSLRNVITRALGTQSSIMPDVFELEAEPGDLYLLCSDGLPREISDETIESILKMELSLEKLCANLVNAAKKAGGNDNITCVLVRAEG